MLLAAWVWVLILVGSILVVVLLAVHDNLSGRIRSWHQRKWRDLGRIRKRRSILEEHLDVLNRRPRVDWIDEHAVVWPDSEGEKQPDEESGTKA
jgi:hypothetical protein